MTPERQVAARCSLASSLNPLSCTNLLHRMYKRDALTGGHVIMLGASEANTQAALEALRAYPGGLQVGGGWIWGCCGLQHRLSSANQCSCTCTLCIYGLAAGGINADNCRFFVENGASHVIVTSYVFRDGQIDFERLTNLKDLVGKEHLVSKHLMCRIRSYLQC